MTLTIRRLRRDHDVAAFDCGDDALNRYLREHALSNQDRYIVGVTHVVTLPDDPEPLRVVGYYTLASHSVPLTDVPRTPSRPPYADVPTLLIARLAVDRSSRRLGIGERLLKNAIGQAVLLNEHAAVRFVMVDAYRTAVKWYERYGFVAVEPAPDAHTVKMFLDMRTVHRGQESSR